MPSLALKASINYPFIGGSSGPPPYVWVDPDGQDWYNRVVSSGCSITNANQSAFDTAFLALKSNNIWNKITQGCFFVGIDGANPLAGAFTPFKSPSGITPTNTNFTSEDYNRLTGILSDGGINITSTKYINTNINNVFPYYEENPLFPIFDRHLLLYNTRNDLVDALDVGTIYDSNENFFQFKLSVANTSANWEMNNNQGYDDLFAEERLYIQNGSRGFAGIQYNDTGTPSIAYFFENNYLKFNPAAERYNPKTAIVPFTDLSDEVVINGFGTGGKKRIAYYSLGLALPDTANNSGLSTVQAYNTIINNLLSSLS